MDTQIDPALFKGYDVRGIVGENLTEPVMELIGKGFGSSLPEGSTIFIGADPRTHSPSLLKAFLDGLTDTGVSAVDAGMVPTPLLTYLLATRNASGAEITASHNPPKYNGVKMYLSGKDLSATQMQALSTNVLAGNFRSSQNKGTVSSESFNDEYVDFISSKVKSARRLKVVVDTGNGACGLVAAPIYQKMDCDVTSLFWEPDGTFPNHPADPHKEENLVSLKQKVLELKADLGIALDGDGDRVAFVDELGNKVRSDDAVLLFAQQLLKSSPGARITYDLRMTNAFKELIPTWGGTPIICACGRTNVSKSMRENDATIGGEQTGHTFFKEMFYHDDAIFAGAKMIQLLSAMNQPLSKLVQFLPHHPSTPELRIAVGNDLKYEIVKNAVANLSEQAPSLNASVSTLDGVRLDLTDGSWGLVRVSNTSPEVTLRFEGPTKESLEKVYFFFRDYLLAKGVILPANPPS